MAGKDVITSSISRNSEESQEFVISLSNLFLPQVWNYQALPMCPFLRLEQQIPSFQSSAEREERSIWVHILAQP